jgi:hypothetical protein
MMPGVSINCHYKTSGDRPFGILRLILMYNIKMVLGEIDVKMYIGFSKVSGSIIAGNF